MIAFIETPLQIVSINHLKLGYEIEKIYLISRKNWHVNTKQILDQNNQIKEINIFSAFIICLLNSIREKCSNWFAFGQGQQNFDKYC